MSTEMERILEWTVAVMDGRQVPSCALQYHPVRRAKDLYVARGESRCGNVNLASALNSIATAARVPCAEVLPYEEVQNVAAQIVRTINMLRFYFEEKVRQNAKLRQKLLQMEPAAVKERTEAMNIELAKENAALRGQLEGHEQKTPCDACPHPFDMDTIKCRVCEHSRALRREI
jgi:hypothetical protein